MGGALTPIFSDPKDQFVDTLGTAVSGYSYETLAQLVTQLAGRLHDPTKVPNSRKFSQKPFALSICSPGIGVPRPRSVLWGRTSLISPLRYHSTWAEHLQTVR
jgi:hypothetical protein